MKKSITYPLPRPGAKGVNELFPQFRAYSAGLAGILVLMAVRSAWWPGGLAPSLGALCRGPGWRCRWGRTCHPTRPWAAREPALRVPGPWRLGLPAVLDLHQPSRRNRRATPNRQA